MSKAFDTLNHDILLDKLAFYGISGINKDLFKCYLSNRKQYVQFNGKDSHMFHIRTGVPQGSILGPLLFLIYINDFVNSSKLFHFIIFADDTTVISKTDVVNDKIINQELGKLLLWLQLNKLSLNISKSKCIFFHQPQKKCTKPAIKIDGNTIDSVDSFNFLGLIINNNLKWDHHINHIAAKISRSMGILTRLRHSLPFDVILLLYNSLILPHMNYGLLAWGHQHDKISLLQKKITRIITFSKLYAHTEPLLKQLFFLKLNDMFKLQQLKFYYRYLKQNLPRYFQSLSFNQNEHRYNTRNKDLYVHIQVKKEFVKRCLLYSITHAVNIVQISLKINFTLTVFLGSYYI